MVAPKKVTTSRGSKASREHVEASPSKVRPSEAGPSQVGPSAASQSAARLRAGVPAAAEDSAAQVPSAAAASVEASPLATPKRSRRDKLRRAFQVDAKQKAVGTPAPPVPPATPARGNVRAFLQARRDRIAEGMPANLSRDVVELPDADILETEHGPLWRRELRYPVWHKHGRVELDAGRKFDRERLAKIAKSPSFTELKPDECLFLDTETTGLSGGAGTMVFGYGIAFFEGEELVLEQLFLRDFGEEPAMLHHIAKRLGEHPVPVTFVGKSYDRHRIAARLAVHKIKAPILTDRHLDLYHVIRREFGKQWPDSRLHTAEERLLGLYREDDLPGSEAPAAFLDWIRDRTGPVDRVMEHNRLDVLSLAALLGVVTKPAG